MKNYRFPIILLLSILIGAIVGLVKEEAVVFQPIGDVFLNLLFTIIVPLIFFTISSSIANMNGANRLGKIIGWMFGTFLFTGLVSAIYMFFIVKLVNPGEGVKIKLIKPESAEELNPIAQIVKTFTVPDFVELFSRSNMLALIVISILIGFAAQSVGERGKPFTSFLSSGSEVMMKVVSLIMYLAPIGLGAYFASLVGQYGPILLGSYIKAGITYYLASLIYFFVAFTIYAFMAGKGKGIRVFWSNMLAPSITALATCSSAASIPVNLEASSRMGIKKDIRDTTIPLGAALHKDGSVIGGVLKIIFLFGIFDMNSGGIGNFFLIISVSLLVGAVMGAIPSGGMIGEMLILSLFGFPPEALPIIAAISTLIDPPATMLNASGDNVAGMMVSRMVEGKNWLNKSA
ncbi:dicarboxylate/amino acid:cation symporter [Neobacillus niacini]|uniref:dicarboxylate/amino acid:cation symporter n=1 Tax=Neobacillus niacini TaxID=86668 RepID=UPI002FFEED2E